MTDHNPLDDLLVDEPEEHRLADCLDGIIGISKDDMNVVPQEGFEDLPNAAQAVAFCIGQWAAHYLDIEQPTHPKIARVVAETPLQRGDFERHKLLSVTDGRVGINVDDLDDAITFVNEAKAYAERRSATKQNGDSVSKQTVPSSTDMEGSSR